MKILNHYMDRNGANEPSPEAEAHASTGQALRERLKEITCLYEIRRGMGPELPADQVCQQIFRNLIPAMQFPELAVAAIELDGKYYTSDHHSQGHTHELQSQISVNSVARGRLRVFYPADKPFLVPDEQKLIDAIASDMQMWLERKQIDEALRERLKEITCLYEIRRGMGLELSMDGACQQIFKHLIPAMQFPEIATAVIELNGNRFAFGRHKQGPAHELQAKISASNNLQWPITRILSRRQALPDT